MFHNTLINQIGHEYQHLKAKVHAQEQEFYSGESELFTGVAIISFENQSEAYRAISKYRRRGFLYSLFGFGRIVTNEDLSLEVQGKEYKLWASRPAEPNDIMWPN